MDCDYSDSNSMINTTTKYNVLLLFWMFAIQQKSMYQHCGLILCEKNLSVYSV